MNQGGRLPGLLFKIKPVQRCWVAFGKRRGPQPQQGRQSCIKSLFLCFSTNCFFCCKYKPGSAGKSTANSKLRIIIQGTHTGHISWQFLCYLSLGPAPAASSCARPKCSCMIWPRFRMRHSKWSSESSDDFRHQWSPTPHFFALFYNQHPNSGSTGNPTKKLNINGYKHMHHPPSRNIWKRFQDLTQLILKINDFNLENCRLTPNCHPHYPHLLWPIAKVPLAYPQVSSLPKWL